jgi:hypothetical protein
MALLTISPMTWALVGFFGVGTLLLIVPAVALAKLVVDACVGAGSYEAPVAEVQRFLELTERSRRALREGPRLPLLDREGGVAAARAISRALELRHEARRELWPPCTVGEAVHVAPSPASREIPEWRAA